MRSADLALAVTLAIAAALSAVGLVVYVPRQPGLAAWAPAIVTGFATLSGFGAAVAVGLAALARRVPDGPVVFESDGGFVVLGLAVLPLALVPVLLGAAVEGVSRGARGVPGGAFLGLLALAFGGAGLAMATVRQEVRVADVDGARAIVVISGRGWPSVRSWPAASARLEVVRVEATRNPSWKVVLVDGAKQVIVGRAGSEAEAWGMVARLRG